jgi:superfamily I DNA/RNA helicase
MKTAMLIGSAGSGKTTELLRVMEGAKSALGGSPFAVGFASMTKAARQEAVERASLAWGVPVEVLSRDGWFKTAHGICHKQLGVVKGQMIDDKKESQIWLAGALKVDIRTLLDEDDGRVRYAGDKTATAALECWDVSRARIEPLKKTVERMVRAGREVPPFARCKQLVDRYEQAKRLENRSDFTDLLARYAGIHFEADGFYFTDPEGELPAGVRAWIFDEAQDASALVDKVCRRLANGPEVAWVYVAGDPFQCSLEGTPVLTASGYKPIEDLDPKTDKLIAFSKKEGRFYGTSKQIPFSKAWRDVDSRDLIEVTFEDGTKSVCTTNHKWYVRTKKREAYATYLMQKGSRWRVGTVQMFSKKRSEKNGEFRLKMRMNQEDADSVWVLKVFDTDRDARMHEQIVSCRYGIPQVTFRPPHGKTNLSREFIDGVFSAMGDMTESGRRCLDDHDRDILFPFCQKADRSKNGCRAGRFLQAVNVLPGIHLAPRLIDGVLETKKRGTGPRGSRTVGSHCEWVAVKSIRRLAPGSTARVYSLEVEKYHTYVVENGYVTGNSIYGFCGSDSKHFMSWPADKKRIMPKSYRCPAPILSLGEKCLRQMHEGYFDREVSPADHDGRISRGQGADSVVPSLDPTKSTLILARCNFMLDEWAAVLRKKRLPFAKLKAKSDTAVLRGIRALWDLEHGEAVSGEDFACAIEEIPSRGKDGPLLERGTKTNWRREETQRRWDAVFPSALGDTGMTQAMVDRVLGGTWADLVDGGEKFRAAALKWGAELAARPQIRLGSVHSAKGMEADVVVLSTTLTRKIHEARSSDRAQHDEERRVEYVGVTRARRELIISDDPVDFRMGVRI